MTAFRLFVGAAWMLIATITGWAIWEMGLPAAPATFVRDLAHPWRAQFYADLEAHLLLVAWWIFNRERSPAIGIFYGAATVLLGALFTMPYILIATVRAKGDPRAVLLGVR